MCIAIPAEVVAVSDLTARVDLYGDQFDVSLAILPDEVAVGDFLIVQARRHAVAKLSRAEAEETRRLFEEMFPELAQRVRAEDAA